MTVISPSSVTQTAWAPIEQEFGELLSYQEDLERALEQTFAELHQWRSTLNEQQRQLERERDELAAGRQAIQSDRENCRHTADSTGQQLAQTQHELVATQTELAQLRAAHESAERQLSELSRCDSQPPSADHDALFAERAELELELENIRARAAQLSDTLAETRRQLVQERQQWDHERQVLRSEIEDLHAREPLQPVAVAAELASDFSDEDTHSWRAAPSVPTIRPPEDIVLGSVLAQFQKLSGDRRARQKQAG